MSLEASSNDVWGTINSAISTVAGYKRDVALAKISSSSRPGNQTTAAPSGNPGTRVFNPLPGMFKSDNPQAEGKTGFDSSSASSSSLLWIVLAILVGVLVLGRVASR